MKLRQHLRVTNSQQSTFKRILYQHPGRIIHEVQADIRYLQLQMMEGNRQVTAFFDIDSWLLNMESHLPGIPWKQVPLSYLVSWLNTLQLSFLVEGILWKVEYISMPEQLLPKILVSLVADPCTILCTDWPDEYYMESDSGLSLSWLPLRLRYILGTSKVQLSTITQIMPGDLLLIKKQIWSLDVGNYKLFIFNYQSNNEVVVTKKYIDDVPSVREEEACLLDWKNLPVDLEFVLDSHVITLGELNTVDSGSLLPVSTDAEQKIKIYLNQRFFATGELVALENGGLAVEVNQINMHTEDKMSHSDVE